MVRSIHKINIIFTIIVVALMAILYNLHTGGASAINQAVDFNVNLVEVLTVSVTNPTTWASGSTDSLLRNKVTVSALTNNYYGARVSMYAGGTQLQNTTSYSSTDNSSFIDTLTNSNYTYSTFPTDAWGYSLTDSESGTASASYLPVTTSASPVTILNSTIGTTGTKDVYFGAKASSNKQSGTYAQTVYFAAVTGTIDTDNPAVPVNPSHDNPTDEIASYTPSTNRTTYTTRTTTTRTPSVTPSVDGNTSKTTTQVSNGNTTKSYANAAGVTTVASGSSTTGSSTLPIALGVAAGVTAVSGTIFFVLAKRRNDDDDEEEQ